MAAKGFSDNAFVRTINSLAVGLLDVPLLGRFIRRRMVEIRYVGRKSGKTFQTPVNYRRSDDSIVIWVGLPDRKNWWRNFLDEGGPVTLIALDGRDRTGHAVATRSDEGGVSVRVRLDP
jgi:hypothetical protein